MQQELKDAIIAHGTRILKRKSLAAWERESWEGIMEGLSKESGVTGLDEYYRHLGDAGAMTVMSGIMSGVEVPQVHPNQAPEFKSRLGNYVIWAALASNAIAVIRKRSFEINTKTEQT